MNKAHSDQPTKGYMNGKDHYLPIRVYYEDTDAGGMVYHANYIRYMERGRTEFMRCYGVEHSDLYSLERGFKFAVSDLTIKYRAPAILDDALIVISKPRVMKGATFLIDQEIKRGDEVVAEASIRVACLDNDNRPRRIPKDLYEKFKPLYE